MEAYRNEGCQPDHCTLDLYTPRGSLLQESINWQLLEYLPVSILQPEKFGPCSKVFWQMSSCRHIPSTLQHGYTGLKISY